MDEKHLLLGDIPGVTAEEKTKLQAFANSIYKVFDDGLTAKGFVTQ